jgi:hypothetical protein
MRHFETGEPIWLFHYLFCIRDAAGKIVGLATVSRDITERKALDTALQEAGQRYINLLRATKDAFWLIEAGSGRLLDVNEARQSQRLHPGRAADPARDRSRYRFPGRELCRAGPADQGRGLGLV